MSFLEDESTLMKQIKSLCETLVSEEQFKSLHNDIESFLSNDEARLAYQNVHELGDSLNQKQSAGVELSDNEINEFEEAREQVLANDLVNKFMDAQHELQIVQKLINQHVGLTIELGRVPTNEEVSEAQHGGCCGGGSCGSGGC